LAHSLSSKKRIRRNLKRSIRNKSVRSQYKTYTTKALKEIKSGDLQTAEQAVKQAISILDKTAKKGVLHRNNVARRKSQLAKKLNVVRAAS
jgi:small subunit ribosomal protein S20